MSSWMDEVSGRSALVKKEIQENGSSNTTIRNLHPQPSLTAKELMGSKSFGLKIKTLNCIEMGHFTLPKTGMKNGRSPWEKKDSKSDRVRFLLQKALDSMPRKAAKLIPKSINSKK